MGIPVLVACDVARSPSFVKSVAAKFAVKLFRPSKNLTQEEKQLMAKGVFDRHIRDAYAAAIKAYHKYENRFRRIDAIYPEKAEQYKKLILEGVAIGKIHGARSLALQNI